VADPPFAVLLRHPDDPAPRSGPAVDFTLPPPMMKAAQNSVYSAGYTVPVGGKK
jgi:hypothetical protein